MEKEYSEVKQQVNRAMYALLSLTVGGVLAFAAYVVSDLKEDVVKCRVMLISIHQELANIHAVQARYGERADELKRQVIEMHNEMDKKW